MAAVKRTVAHALFAYVDPDGVQRMAVRGDTIRIDGAELERAERFGVFDFSVPEDAEEPSAEPEAQDPDGEGDGDGDGDLERPPLAAAKEAWVEFRFQESDGRLTKEELNELTKPQLQDDEHIAGLSPA